MENLKIKRLMNIINKKYFLLFVFQAFSIIHETHTLQFAIDNRLFVAPSDCYRRVSIGFRLPDSLIISSFEANSISDCEAACSTNGTLCGSFSFGVGVRGNGTCMLGQGIQSDQDSPLEDRDYDIYVKGHISLLGCLTRSDKLFNIVPPVLKNQMDVNANINNNTPTLMINSNPKKIFGNSSLLNFLRSSIFSNDNNQSFIINNSNNNQNISNNNNNNMMPRQRMPGSFMLLQTDDQTRIHDILRNKQTSHYHPEHEYHDKTDEFNYFPTIYYNFGTDDFESDTDNFWSLVGKEEDKNNDIHYNKKMSDNNDNNNLFAQKVPVKNNELFFSTDASDVAEFGKRLNTRPTFVFDTNYKNLWLNSGPEDTFLSEKLPEKLEDFEVEKIDILKGEKACFRRLVSGKRIINTYVRRTIECDRLQDCYRMCEYERGFTCEGFNYRSLNGKSMCEMTSTPPNQVNIHRDFMPDRSCDFYERDWTHSCFHKPPKDRSFPQNWWSPSPRPNWNSDRYPEYPLPPKEPRPLPAPPSSAIIPYGGSFKENTQLTIEIPKPLTPPRRYPDNSWTKPRDRPLPVQPLEAYYPGFGERRPSHDGFYSYNKIPHRAYYPGEYDSYNGNGYSYGHLTATRYRGSNYYHRYPQRRVGYGTDPTINEIAPPDYRKLSKYGGSNGYGHSYADSYHNHYIGDRPQLPPANDREPPPYSIKIPSDHLPGPAYNYGGVYDYPNHPNKVMKPVHESRQCSVRSAGGFKLAKGIVRKSFLTPNVEQCEQLCEEQKDFICLTFAFRYNIAPTSPSDNCFLSNIPFESLVFYTDLEPDRDYDIYAMMDSKWCETRMKPPYPPSRPHPPDECFWRVRSGFGMPTTVIKKPVHVDGIGECQIQCVRSRDFTCRSFVYKYEVYPVHGTPNCYLSDWTAMEINPEQMPDMNNAELYERGSFGRGCEPHLPAPSIASRPDDRKHYLPDDASCYTGYDRPCKLTPYAIVLATRVHSEVECRRKCSLMRRESTPCMSFSYRINGDHRGDNCYLSDIPTRDLRPGLDYIHDDGYLLYMWKELEPKCLWFANHYEEKPNYYPLSHPSGNDNGHNPNLERPPIRPEDPYIYEITIPEPNRPASIPSGPGSLGPVYETEHPGYPGVKPEYGIDEKFFITIPDEFSVFRHFTVNGFPCKRGTRCERNWVAGFWTCEPEGSEPGAWDYCCEPSHQCGYSPGHNFPWCYVGSSKDQWRPCSEKYYPYQLNPRSNRPIDRSSRPRFHECDSYCQGRHWPIAFLHGEAPPNSTDSVALANDVTDRDVTESSTFTYVETTLPDMENMTNQPSTNPSTSSESVARKRGVRLSAPRIFKNKRNLINGLPVKIVRNRSNRTLERIMNLKSNSSIKLEQRRNTSIGYSPQFTKDPNSGQYYITKKLNAGLAAQNNEDNKEQSKPNMAKIEKISKNDLSKNVTTVEPHFVTLASSIGPKSTTNSLKVTLPSIRVVFSNESSISNNTRQWEKVTTIGNIEE
ncbi:uncharacterized protein [Chelonus insularis]|uniref:uncharacterized protein isoform X2 n=1 Tax=Chelonus insularis TaxID=460826 RepID=UPI00158D39D8|nr:uncharacterized protein LOC118068473 isoform X2 [Chelonus insularis]